MSGNSKKSTFRDDIPEPWIHISQPVKAIVRPILEKAKSLKSDEDR